MNCYEVIRNALSIQARNTKLPLWMSEDDDVVTVTLGVERAEFSKRLMADMPEAKIEEATRNVGRRLIEQNRVTRIKAIDVTCVKPRARRRRANG